MQCAMTVRLAEAHRQNKSRRHKDGTKADDTRTQQKQTIQGHNKSRRHKDTTKADDIRTQQKQTTQGHNKADDTRTQQKKTTPVVPPL